MSSPIYIDLRLTVSHPDLLRDICDALADKVKHVPHDLLCGVPYTAIPFATALTLSSKKPMLMRRKEAKMHGTKKLIEGHYTVGQTVLIVEDLVTSGLSVMETVQPLRDLGLVTNHVVVLIDRLQGASKNLSKNGISIHSVFTLNDMLSVLLDSGKIEASVRDSVLTFIQENQIDRAVPSATANEGSSEVVNGKENYQSAKVAEGAAEEKVPKSTPVKCASESDEKVCKVNVEKVDEKKENDSSDASTDEITARKTSQRALTYSERAALVRHPMAKRLFELMESKQTNLAVAADVTSTSALLELAESVGPHIALLKTHADIISDWTGATAAALRDLAVRHNFLVFEDRKFADIGNTAFSQVTLGVHRIASWADVVNAHAVAGDGVISGLSKAVDQSDDHGWRKFGILLLAQMSSKDNLASGLEGYTEKTVEMAKRHPEHVFGFISMQKISDDSFVYLTPGVSLADANDGLGQQYCSPDAVVADRGSDVIIVGRGVYQAEDKAAAAKRYRHAGWKAYERRTSGIN